MGNACKKPIYFAEQNYEEIKSECQKNDQLFDDPIFPSSDPSTLNNTENPTEWSNIVWKRPHDIVSNPKFFVDGSSRHDIQQGSLGDCWLLAAMSSLAMRKDLIGSVALLWHNAKVLALLKVKCEIYSCVLEPPSTDSLGHQHHAKKLSPKIAV